MGAAEAPPAVEANSKAMDDRSQSETVIGTSIHVSSLPPLYSLRGSNCYLPRYAAFVVVAGLALWRAISSFSLRQMPTSFMDLFGVGFGALTQFTFLVLDFPRSDPTGLLINVLVVNMLQLFFSIMYLVANAIFSTCLIQREFSLMYSEDKRKALRVSEPVGIQRSSYFITIPFRYGIPLYIVAGLTHWVLSQSFFLARITALTTDGLQDDGNSFSTCGYSPGAIIVRSLSTKSTSDIVSRN